MATFTEDDLKSIYANGMLNVQGVSSLLEATRNADGTLTDSTILSIITILYNKNIIPIMDVSKDPSIFNNASKVFQDIVRDEYNFYNDRYFSALDTYFTTIIGNTPNISGKYLVYCKNLNKKLNDIILIVNGINIDLKNKSSNLDTETKRFLSTIENKKKDITYQKNLLKSTNLETIVKKQMVKYTEEKGRYSDRLLKLYSFLNIVALGLLIYIYKAVHEE